MTNIHLSNGGGTDVQDHMKTDVELRLPVNALVSYHYFKDHDIAEMHGWGLRLIGDSGAFSAASLGAPVDIDQFAEWAFRWRDNLHWVASLDEIGDPDGSWKNYEYLRGLGLDVVPTIHYGGGTDLIDKYVAEGIDFIGLGGMVPYKSEPKRLLAWCLHLFRYVRDNHPQVRFHGWGVTHPDLIMNLPWYSVDSSGFSAAYRYGRLGLFDPARGKIIGVNMNGKDIYQHATLLREHYGIEPERVSESTTETRRDIVRVALKAVQYTEDHLHKKHGFVSAPTYGLTDPSKGTVVSGVLPSRDGTLGALSPDGQVPKAQPLSGMRGGKVHSAIGFPSSQATKAVNPQDSEPRLIE